MTGDLTFLQTSNCGDCYEKHTWLRWLRMCDLRNTYTEGIVNTKCAYPVSTGFLRIILAAGVCCITGMVSLIG